LQHAGHHLADAGERLRSGHQKSLFAPADALRNAFGNNFVSSIKIFYSD
jgi:hypothetical protein